MALKLHFCYKLEWYRSLSNESLYKNVRFCTVTISNRTVLAIKIFLSWFYLDTIGLPFLFSPNLFANFRLWSFCTGFSIHSVQKELKLRRPNLHRIKKYYRIVFGLPNLINFHQFDYNKRVTYLSYRVIGQRTVSSYKFRQQSKDFIKKWKRNWIAKLNVVVRILSNEILKLYVSNEIKTLRQKSSCL